ncbi:MAG: response regulator [Lachnospiraceae bacterium]|nr:response regulator [Lachnospiraceae bacterium]
MIKILFIGKMDNEMQEKNEYLRNFARVVLCVETTQNAAAMLELTDPDLVLVLLQGVYDVDMSIFEVLCRDYPSIPVLTVGSVGEFRNFSTYFSGNQFENLLSPVENEDLLLAICRRLSLTPDEVKGVSGADTGKKHLLLVDDNAMTLRSLKSMLESKYKISLANSGMKAMTSIGKDRPDLILLDYEMPVCDGRQTLEMIRADDEIKDIPVIFLTGVNDREHIQAVLKLQPSGYLLKPADQQTLMDTIEKAL